MKLLVVSPGADISTKDVFDGLVPALRRQGHDVVEYPLSTRIARAGAWLAFNYRRARKEHPDVPEPTFADTLYLAAERVLPIALRNRVDWVLVVSGMYFHPDWFWMLQRAGVPTALLLTETPYDQDKEARVLPYVTCAWTNERSSVPFLRAVNPNVHYLPHAYDPFRHHPAALASAGTSESEAASVLAHDVVFVGTGFQERIDLLAGVDWSGIDFGLYGIWDQLGRRHPLRQFVRGEQVENHVAAALYRRAKIGLNLYRRSIGYGKDAPRIAHAESLNPRALELAACGLFHLSDERAEVGEVFGTLVPTFKTSAELERILRHWLARPAARFAISQQLPQAVVGRTFDAMAMQITADLEAFARSKVAA